MTSLRHQTTVTQGGRWRARGSRLEAWESLDPKETKPGRLEVPGSEAKGSESRLARSTLPEFAPRERNDRTDQEKVNRPTYSPAQKEQEHPRGQRGGTEKEAHG